MRTAGKNAVNTGRGWGRFDYRSIALIVKDFDGVIMGYVDNS